MTIKCLAGASLRLLAAGQRFALEKVFSKVPEKLWYYEPYLRWYSRNQKRVYVLARKGNLLQHMPPMHQLRPWAYDASDYTVDFCEDCQKLQVVFSVGITACPDCGKPLYPCTGCSERGRCQVYDCMYGTPFTFYPELNAKQANNPAISRFEQEWFQTTQRYAEQKKELPWWRKNYHDLPF